MIAALVAGLLPFTIPWKTVPPPPEDVTLALTQPPMPDPPPDGSIIDMPAERELPARWRSTDDAPTKGQENAGLNSLHASGSGQFCRDQFYAVREKLRAKRVVVVDLRQEPHTFLDGAALAWGPPDKLVVLRSAPEVEHVESVWTQRLDAGKFTTVTQYAPDVFARGDSWQPIHLELDIREAQTESLLSAIARWGYYRIAAPDAVTPRDQDVDRLVSLVRELDDDVWLHFHCDTGANRTTLFLTLYDMMRNSIRASRAQIIARQRALGGIDLLSGKARDERADFLERFYSYCWQCGPQFRRSWTSWNRAQLRNRN